MFEREIRDASFIKRWSIVRTVRSQSVAEHSYFVAMYTNDICVLIGVPETVHLTALQYALWHDTQDEIFTGDIPGPAKRTLIPDPSGRAEWDDRIGRWSDCVFERLSERSGVMWNEDIVQKAKAIVKVADWLDAACEMATEVQLGNKNCSPHMVSQTNHVLGSIEELGKLFGVNLCKGIPFDLQEGSIESNMWLLYNTVEEAILTCANNHSLGPKVISDRLL